jgi:hypothetical protein
MAEGDGGPAVLFGIAGEYHEGVVDRGDGWKYFVICGWRTETLVSL